MDLARIYYAGRVGIGSTDAGSAGPEATQEVNLFGTPEEVVEKIHMFREAFTTDEIMFECNWTSSVPREVVMDTLKCLSEDVIPHFCKQLVLRFRRAGSGISNVCRSYPVAA